MTRSEKEPGVYFPTSHQRHILPPRDGRQSGKDREARVLSGTEVDTERRD